MATYLREPAGRSRPGLSRADLSATLGIDPGRLPAAPGATAKRPVTGGMFANRLPAQRKLSEELQACLGPTFKSILGDPGVEARIEQAMAAARSTPNWGFGMDIPAYGSEHGFYAGKIPLYGAVSGRSLTSRRERQTDFDPSYAPWMARHLTAIHTHQSPRGAPGLSQADIRLTYPRPRGQGVNVVAFDRSGARYCKVAQ